MTRGIRIPKEMGDKLARTYGLAPGGLKCIEIDFPPGVDEKAATVAEVLSALSGNLGNLKVRKHFEFAALQALAGNLLDAYKPSASVAPYPPVHVILVQAAALECFLNDVLIHFADEEYGVDGRTLGEALTNGSLRSKLYRVVPTLSRGMKVLDLASPAIRNLECLITTRNKIAHTAEYYIDVKTRGARGKRHKKPVAHEVTPSLCRRLQKSLSEFTSAVWNAPPWEGKLFKVPPGVAARR